MCRNCIFELAYAIAMGQPEPWYKVSDVHREAALRLIERAGLVIPGQPLTATSAANQ